MVAKCSDQNPTQNQPLKCPARPSSTPARPRLRRVLTRAGSLAGHVPGSGVRWPGAGRGSHRPDSPEMQARAEELGLCPGLTTGQWGCTGQVDTPRVVVSVARPELSSRSLHRKGTGRLGACESGWEAGVTLVPDPEYHGQCGPQPAPCALGRPAPPVPACCRLPRVSPLGGLLLVGARQLSLPPV